MVSHPLDLTDRKSLIASLPKEAAVAEIGVAEGIFSQVILDLARPRFLWLIDPWLYQSAEVIGHDPANISQAQQDANYQAVLSKFRLRPEVVIVRDYSRIAGTRYFSNSFDWVYIDANHLEAGKDLEVWYEKVKPGGWITGHDYTMCGDYITVKADVDQFIAKRGLELFVTRGDNDIYERNYPSFAIRRPL